MRFALAFRRIAGVVVVNIEEGAYRGEIVSAVAVGEQTIMADAVQAFGEDVDQEATDKLVSAERHRPVSLMALAPVILDAECNGVRFGLNQPSVRDCDAVGVARQVGKHGLRPGERLFDIDVPFGLA